MSLLESALVAIVSPERRQPPFTVGLATHYRSDFLEGILSQMTKSSSGRGVAWTGHRGRRAGSANVQQLPYHPSFFGARLEVFTVNTWQYDEIDEAGQTVLSLGFDGVRGWSQAAHGSRTAWSPTASGDPRQLPESAWQFHASLVVREIVEPVLMLPALAIDAAHPHSSRHGAAVRLVGHPQLADRIESALVSLAARSCMVDIQLETGTVVEATSLDEMGEVLVRHTVEELRYGST